MSKRLFFFSLSLFFFTSNYAVVKGSETAVSVEAAVTFPSIDADNTMLGFDCFIDVYSGVYLRVLQGALHYKNADSTLWNQKNFSILYMEKNTQLILHSVLNLGNGVIYFNQGTLVHHLLGGDLVGKVHAEGSFTFEYEQ